MRSRRTPEANQSETICHAPHAWARRRVGVLLLLLFIGHTTRVAAQGEDPHVIQWWQGAVAIGGVTALMLLDHPLQRYAQHNDGPGARNVASVVRHAGQPEVYGGITLGLAAAGLISRDPRLTRAAGRLGASLLLAGATSSAGKLLFGRPRPESSLDADGYVPFSGQASMPSGHSTMAFALATSLSDDIHRPWASVGLYGLATATAWSRVSDNRHWFSDVATGALIGITSAKLASGRWRIFGIRPPSIIRAPAGMSIGWRGSF
jgi:membrane-associated phospholipid phosphatase